jgi:hypothetical protein
MTVRPEELQSFHRALIGFNKRAERVSDEMLALSFVDSAPLFDLMATNNNQVIYGRRGTGKTHALRYLFQIVAKQGQHPVYIDLRSVGSNGSIYNDGSRPLAERASTLIVDVLNALYDELYSVALAAIDSAPHPEQITARLDDLSAAINSVRVTGSVEEETQQNTTESSKAGLAAKATIEEMPALEINANVSDANLTTASRRIKRTGNELSQCR